ncbi:MAG TPA: hypothetical protein VNR42_07805 [Solirubrobacteraceae bacterium]|nr:hypothetical protein [Solirubrobacteraceae bacterium]
MTATSDSQIDGRRAAMLAVFSNLSRYHREHEKYYGEAPLRDAAALARTSRALKALAEQWSTAHPASTPVASPFAGASDLNSEVAIETSGVLFMESGAEPAEIGRIVRELETAAADAERPVRGSRARWRRRGRWPRGCSSSPSWPIFSQSATPSSPTTGRTRR